MGSIDDLVRDLRRFDGRREVTRALRRRIREPIPTVRSAIKRRALDVLPGRNGLAAWVARTKVTAKITLSGRAAGVRLKGGRNSKGGRTDTRSIDKGTVRAPSWGRRADADWHSQRVPAGFFSEPAAEVDQWRRSVLDAVDDALVVIRRG